MDKKAILLKQEIVAAFMECEDGGDYLESGTKKFERKLDEILTAHEGVHDVDYLISKIDDYVMSGQVSTKEALLAIADFSNWLDKEGE